MSRDLLGRSFKVLLYVVAVATPPACTRAHHCPPGYDIFGPYTVPAGGNVGEILSQRRGFIWRHWHDHRPACAEVTTTSMWEGVRCASILIVEPDQRGRWHVIEKWDCGPGTGGTPKATSGTSTWYSVERVREGGAGWRRNPQIPDSENVPPDSYILVFRDISGRNESPM